MCGGLITQGSITVYTIARRAEFPGLFCVRRFRVTTTAASPLGLVCLTRSLEEARAQLPAKAVRTRDPKGYLDPVMEEWVI